jgi:hypothetical protein
MKQILNGPTSSSRSLHMISAVSVIISVLCFMQTTWAFQVPPISISRSSSSSRFSTVSTFMKKGSGANSLSSGDLDGIETDASRASENWDIAVTPFLNEENAKLVKERLANRADVGYLQVGGLPSSLRTRFVMTNPDLDLDRDTTNSEHCVLLCVENIRNVEWPHALTRIGVELKDVGDVIVEDEFAYMVVAPDVVKQCCRLLPKELRGVGVTVSVVEPGEYLPVDGEQQKMELGKLDKRALKYK